MVLINKSYKSYKALNEHVWKKFCGWKIKNRNNNNNGENANKFNQTYVIVWIYYCEGKILNEKIIIYICVIV